MVVFRLNAAGNGFEYATFLGYTNQENAFGIAVDSTFNTHVTGQAGDNFPGVSSASFQQNYAGNVDGFVVKLNPSGTGFVYSIYIGGTGTDQPRAIAIDATGAAYIAGSGNSTATRPAAGLDVAARRSAGR